MDCGKILIAIASAFTLSVTVFGGDSNESPPVVGPQRPDNAREEIEAIVAGMVDRWNSHDLVGFMNFAWNSPEFLEIEDGQIRRGWAENLAAYYDGFKDTSQMGRIEIRLTHFDVIKPDVVAAVMQFTLYLPNGKTIPTNSTEIFRRFGNDWKVVFSEDTSLSP